LLQVVAFAVLLAVPDTLTKIVLGVALAVWLARTVLAARARAAAQKPAYEQRLLAPLVEPRSARPPTAAPGRPRRPARRCC
jgi:hypothetical protein